MYFFYSINGNTNAPQCYVMLTLRILFSLRFGWRHLGTQAPPCILRIIRHQASTLNNIPSGSEQQPLGLIKTANDGLCNTKCRTTQGTACFTYPLATGLPTERTSKTRSDSLRCTVKTHFWASFRPYPLQWTHTSNNTLSTNSCFGSYILFSNFTLRMRNLNLCSAITL